MYEQLKLPLDLMQGQSDNALTDRQTDRQTDSSSDVLDHEFLLQDRIQKIQQIIGQYGEDNFYIAFSGGKDSTVLSALIDMALPGNNIPRVYANTGIDLNMVRDFVFKLQETDKRIVVIKPSIPIKQMLEQEGYPFKSKEHAKWVDLYQRNGRTQSIENYCHSEKRDKDLYRTCPKILLYQFTEENKLRISDKCCINLKEKPLDEWSKENNRPHGINGVMQSEGGRRQFAKCLAFRSGKLKLFQPMVPLTSEWEEWFIDKFNIEICPIYLPPYSLIRTGCKACPFALFIQDELDMLEKYFPNEKKQCEIIWKPVFDEYRRLGYRLKQQQIN